MKRKENWGRKSKQTIEYRLKGIKIIDFDNLQSKNAIKSKLYGMKNLNLWIIFSLFL